MSQQQGKGKFTDVAANDLQLAIHGYVVTLLEQFVPKIAALPPAKRAQTTEAILRGVVRAASGHGITPAQFAEYLREIADEIDAEQRKGGGAAKL